MKHIIFNIEKLVLTVTSVIFSYSAIIVTLLNKSISIYCIINPIRVRCLPVLGIFFDIDTDVVTLSSKTFLCLHSKNPILWSVNVKQKTLNPSNSVSTLILWYFLHAQCNSTPYTKRKILVFDTKIACKYSGERLAVTWTVSKGIETADISHKNRYF